METLFLNPSWGKVSFIAAFCLLIYVLSCGLISIIKKRADVADIAWGPGFALIAWVAFALCPFSVYSLAINIFVTLWGLRLAAHIYLKHHKKDEDFRYKALKARFKNNVSLKIFFKVFVLQGLILYIASLPILWINYHPQDISMSAFGITAVLWLVGFALETISDAQLLIFKKDASNHHKLLQSGLWKFVRHPNYLGEIIQWWAIWFLTLAMPFGWALIISPILISYLIIKVSGIAPVEEKMKHLPEFADYANKTPSLVPFSIINGALYFIAWIGLIHFGPEGSFVIPLFITFGCYAYQMYLLSKHDTKSFCILVPLSLYALFLGLIQETLFIHFHLLKYPGHGFLPPFWLMSLYPLFSCTLNTSSSFFNKNLLLSFFVGGAGALVSYLSGQSLGAVHLNVPLAYYGIVLSWGLFLIILVMLNRKLIALRNFYTEPNRLKKTLTVFFDTNCPVCSREMIKLKERKQTGSIIYACPKSDEDLQTVTSAFSYKQAMETIHAVDEEGHILTGIDVLSALYARSNLTSLAVMLQAPGFKSLFKLGYAIWAKYRRRIF